MPLRRDITAHCTCPDDDYWDNRACKHVVAAMFMLSDELLLEPELLDVWRATRSTTSQHVRQHDRRRAASATVRFRRAPGRRPLPPDASCTPCRAPHPQQRRDRRVLARPRRAADVRPTSRARRPARPPAAACPTAPSFPTFPCSSRSNSPQPRRQELGIVLERCAPPRARRLGLTVRPRPLPSRPRSSAARTMAPAAHASWPPPLPHRRSGPAYTRSRGRQRLAGDRRLDRQRRTGRTRQERRDPPRAVLPADRGPPAARRRSGHRQDEPRQGDRRIDRGHLEACPVHPRPPAQRHHRRHGVRPERRDVLVPRGTRLHERADRRRDQPREPEDPVGAARGDGGTPGHRRRREPPGPPPVPRHRHPEPARLPGHLPAPRRAARPLRDAADTRVRRHRTPRCRSSRTTRREHEHDDDHVPSPTPTNSTS